MLTSYDTFENDGQAVSEEMIYPGVCLNAT